MQPSDRPRYRLDDEAFRVALGSLVARTGRSMRSLSLAMGRDPGYVAALLDPARPSRARPTPDDLMALSDATAVPFVELLETLWAIPAGRLADELARLEPEGTPGSVTADLPPAAQRMVAEFGRFLADRHRTGRRGRSISTER